MYAVLLIAYLHFVIEDFRFASLWAGDEVFIENAQDIGANVAKLFLNQAAVRPDHAEFVLGALEQLRHNLLS